MENQKFFLANVSRHENRFLGKTLTGPHSDFTLSLKKVVRNLFWIILVYFGVLRSKFERGAPRNAFDRPNLDEIWMGAQMGSRNVRRSFFSAGMDPGPQNMCNLT